MKRFLYILAVVLSCTVLVLGMLFMLIRSSKVQTAMLDVVAQELSRGLEAEVHIGKADYGLFNKVALHDIYIGDQQGDTLLYTQDAEAEFDFRGFFQHRIIFRHLTLQNPYINIYTLDSLRKNYSFLNVLLPLPQSEVPPVVEIKNVHINDARLRYDEWYAAHLQAAVALNHYSSDSLDAEIEHLEGTLWKRDAECRLSRDSFRLDALEARLLKNAQGISMPQMRVVLPHSEFSTHTVGLLFPLQSDGKQDFSDFRVSLEIGKAVLSPRDIGLFVPATGKISGGISLSGSIVGTINNLYAKDLAINYKQYALLRGDVSIAGLPNIDSAYISAELQDLTLHRALVQDFISDMQNRPYELPKSLSQLGTVHYKGSLQGRIDSLDLYGVFTSKLGSISTQGSLRTANRMEDIHFKGIVQTKRFRLSPLVGNKKIGNISMRAQVDAHTGVDHPLHGKLCATISSIDLNGYTYKNAHIDGTYTKNMYEGLIRIDDPAIGFRFDGLVDLRKQLPIIDFELDIRRLHLGELGFTKRYADSDLRGSLSLDIVGNRLDNINGTLAIDTLSFRNKDKTLFLETLRIIAETGDERPTNFKIQSDYLNANISGRYKYSQLPTIVKRLLVGYLPRLLPEKDRKALQHTPATNDVQFYAYFKNLDLISEVLELPVSIPDYPTIKGFISEPQEQFALQVLVPTVESGERKIDNIAVNLDNRAEQINLSAQLLAYADDTPAGEEVGDLQFHIQSVAKSDSVQFNLDFSNPKGQRNSGSFHTVTRFMQYAGEPLIDLHLLPSQFLLSDSVWTLSDAHIRYAAADTSLQIQNFRLGNTQRFVYAEGIASKRSNDSIHFDISDFPLDYILDFTEAKDVISFGGRLTAQGVVYSLFSTPMLEAEARMDSACINGQFVGDATAVAHLNREKKTIDILGSVVEHGDTVADITGIVAPQNNQRWDLFIKADSVNLGFINFWTKGILEDLHGRGYGEVHVYGENRKSHVTGKALAKDAGLGIGMLGTHYYFTDSITMDYDCIHFSDIELHDAENHPLYVNGVLRHDGSFDDFRYDIDIRCKDALVMNLPASRDDMFYGRVYGTGSASIHGDMNECRIGANARTSDKTEFSLSIGGASSAHDNSFITFVDHTQPAKKEEKHPQEESSNTKVYLDLQIEAMPNAMVNIIIDPKTGDHLEGRGEGHIQVKYDMAADDIKIFGTYTLQQGSFFFTFQNVIRKEFTIRPNSKVIFNGDAENPQIDASAHYSTTASLRDLFGSDISQLSTNRTSVPVNCILYLKDYLMNPLISFGIELPQSDESVTSQVKSIINTDEMLMRQILYLLVFNKFYTPEYLQTTTENVGVSETYSLLSSTITGQINNWLGKLTKDFTVGFNVRSDGTGYDASQEYETQFQYQPNNRLLINGNFGYRYNDISNQPLFGNLDVEYMLSPSGHWRAKAYTHTVDKYSLKEAHTVQGVGLMFKYDFGGHGYKPKKKAIATDTIPSKK